MANSDRQDVLFTEDIYDALKDLVRALGGTKAVGAMFRGPSVPADAAGDWLKDCLNPKNRHTLDPAQVLWLIREGKKVGCHSAINFICDDAGYTRPSPLEPRDEVAELQRRFIEAVHESKRIADRIERLGAMRSVA